MSSFLDLFNINIGTITSNKLNLIDISSSSSIGEAFQLIKQSNVSVLPIYQLVNNNNTNTNDNNTNDNNDNNNNNDSSEFSSNKRTKEYIGIISLSDIITYIINRYKIEAERVNDTLFTSVIEIIGSTKESSIDFSLSIESDQTQLSFVIDKMCQGLHRSLVFDSSDPTHNTAKVLTQTDVVRYFLENVDIFPEIQRALSVNVASTMTGEDLANVTEDTLFIDALQKFKIHSAIPVVNEWGQVVANFSTSDLKTIPIDSTIDWSGYASMTIKQFLTRNSNGLYPKPAVCITSEGDLYTAAKYMIEHRIHRVWAISPVEVSGVQGFGVGCVSLTDIIRVVNAFSTVPNTTL